ncbi:MAG: pyridoxal-phosphate dependent enzyme, partial [Candidatus Berkelbacteria bacterium]|nr:pyridoxal-phosphate dependent enzyme [Candidatus Berkelbacteria bacterium]
MKNNLKDFQTARHNLNNIIKKTELIYSDYFSKISKNKVYLKPENLQITGSYKIRGAYNKIFSLSDKEKKRGLIAASAGNHAQGVALAAQKLGCRATIV